MRRALLNSFIWRGIYFFTTLLLNVCIARVYEATQSGWIYFISNNFYLVLLVGGLSLDSSITYFSASNKISSDRLALFSLSWSFIVTALSIICTAFLVSQRYITSDYVFLFVAGAAYTFGISLTNFFTSLFYANHVYAVPNILMSIINIVIVALMFVFTQGFWGLNKQQFLYVYFLQFILQGLGLALLYLRLNKVRLNKYPDRQEFKQLFNFTFIALSANIAYYLINRVDYLFVENWCSAKSLGNYVQVSKMGQLFLIIPSIISSAVYPQSAKGKTTGLITFILRLVSLFVIFYIAVVIVAYLFSNSIFLWLFGNTFDEMYIPFLILLPGILFLSLHIIIAAYFGGNNKPFYNVISTGAGLVLVLAGDLLLIRPMGIVGAALVSTIGYTTAFIVSLYLFLKMTGSSLSAIFSVEIFKISNYAAFFANRSLNRS